jgi:hypothetical protein
MMSASRTVVGERPIEDHETATREVVVALTIGQLQRRGLTSVEAANLTARLAGLPGVRGGWSPRQLEHLLFLRAIVASGRLAA